MTAAPRPHRIVRAAQPAAFATNLATTFLTSPASAGDSWTRQAPYPADVSLHGVSFTSETTGWISGADDLLMMTTDGGETWVQTASIQRDPLFHEDPIWDIDFVDDQNGFAWGNNGYRTTDGGETWQETAFAGSVYDIDFLTPQRGFLRSNGGVYRTDNAGQSIIPLWDWQDDRAAGAMDFITETHGLISGNDNGVTGLFETFDAGNSWTRISSETFSELLFVDETTVLGAKSGGDFYRSTDGGATWTNVYSDPGGLMEQIRRVDADTFVAIDINVRVWMSHDAGETWTQTFGPVGNWGFEWDVNFPTPDVGYIVGRLGLVYKTTDGGQTWTQISNGAAANLDDIEMSASGVGVAVGGAIVRTDDFGRSWRVVPGNGSTQLHTVQQVDADTWVAAGDFGLFLRSDDGGLTWQQGGDIPGRQCFDLSFINDNDGWAFGELNAPNGYVARTTDGGQTWERMTDSHDFPVTTEGQVMPSLTGWALIPQTNQAITDDGFVTDTPRSLPSGESWEQFEFANDDVGWYGGLFGGVLKSTNGGYISDEQELPGFIRGGGANTDRLTDVRALTETDAWIATWRTTGIAEGIIYQTTDGETWTQLNHIATPDNANGGALVAIDVLDSGEVWALGFGGFIFTSGIPEGSTPAELTGVEVATGTLLEGGLPELDASDDAYVHTRSGFGQTFVDLHNMTMTISAVTSVQSPTTLDLTIESRIDEPAGTARVSLRNWSTGDFETVGSHSIGETETVETFPGLDAQLYVNTSGGGGGGGGGEIDVQIKHIVIVPFFAFTFDSFVDHVEIAVE